MTRRRVVTEREVRRVAREGVKTIDARDAVITPSARDVAAALGVQLQRGDHPAVRAKGVAGSRTEVSAGSLRQPSGARTGARTEKKNTASAASLPKPSGVRAWVPPQQKNTAPAGSLPQPSVPTAGNSSPSTFTIALGADHGGVTLKDAIAARVRELGHAANDLGTSGSDAVDYPDFAVAVSREVAEGRALFGIMVDGAGIGSCMAANKVSGVRAAMCYDVTTALNAREHNNANVLTLGGGLIGTRLALAIVEVFLATQFAGGRHAARVAKIDALD